MSVSQLGGVTYTNQNTPVAATSQQNYQNRLDMQNAIAAQMLDDKEKKVDETRPAEESHKIDPDREHERQKEDQDEENLEEETSPKHRPEEDNNPPPSSILDIKV